MAAMLRLTTQLKGFVLVGALLVGCLPGVVQAKWIKATVTGTVTGTVYADNLQLNDAITLNFIIQNYSGTSGSPNFWEQTSPLPNYTQLFGYGTGTNSTGLVGSFNASSSPGGGGNLIESNNNGSSFLMRVTGTPSSGLSISRSGTLTNVSNIGLSGNLGSFSSSFPGSTDIVDFLSGSLGTKSCTSCTGQIQPNTESPITFTWNNITFEQIEAVPGPLPLAGALVAFRYSRKIRSRIKPN
jgi:hypothetical protein